MPILGLSLGGMSRWNGLAAVTTAAALALVVLIAWRMAARTVPLDPAPGAPSAMLTDVAALVGFLAVFSLRSPDFSAGFRTRRDLAISVGLLLVPIAVFVLAGIGLQLSTGSTDLVGVLAGSNGLPLGNMLVATAMVAPTFTTIYSGSMAMASATGCRDRTAVTLVGSVGLVLAAARFDLMLAPWLAFVASVLPPITVPMAAESMRRRRGLAPRPLPLWVWLPAAAAGLALAVLRQPYSVLASLGLASLLTVIWNRSWATG